jgi:monoamine oxidase
MTGATPVSDETAGVDDDAEVDVDVVVIGAGFAGLTVASALRKAGHSLIVLEARDRVGGKVDSCRDHRGRRVDSGGQFANDDMTEVLALATDAGATRVDAVHAGTARTLPDGLAGDPWRDGEALLGSLGAAHLGDDRSVVQWLAGLECPPTLREAVRSLVNGSTCADSSTIPISYLAHLAERSESSHEELQLWFDTSMHSLAEHLAGPLAADLRLGCPARAVRVHGDHVHVVAIDRVWRARHVVVAVPPSAYGSIRFTPALPAAIATAAQAFAPGTVLKYLLSYASPFWLADGCNGVGQFVEPHGVYFAAASLPDSPRLIGFVGGPTAAEWSRHTADQRQAAIVHHAALAFGDAAERPEAVLEWLWAPDEWGGGGYCNVQVRHSPFAAETLAAGLPHLTFAGTELATRFPGYVEGAITAGRAASDRVLDALARG